MSSWYQLRLFTFCKQLYIETDILYIFYDIITYHILLSNLFYDVEMCAVALICVTIMILRNYNIQNILLNFIVLYIVQLCEREVPIAYSSRVLTKFEEIPMTSQTVLLLSTAINPKQFRRIPKWIAMKSWEISLNLNKNLWK